LSRFWLVIPVDTNKEGLSEWLKKSGYKPPFVEGRYPTLDELVNVLKSISNEEIRIEEYSYPRFAVRDISKEFTISVEDPESDSFICIEGNLDSDNRFKFGFPGSRMREKTMVNILHCLAPICGSLIFLSSNSSTPLLILPDMDINESLQDWHRKLNR
jgi:hypothetical protein